MILALSNEPQSTRAWKSGAEGEQQVARRLAKLADDSVSLLHDRRMPRGGGNIDHIAIGPSGVFVIDAKRYVGKKVEARQEGGVFRPSTKRLFVGGRDKTQLLDGVAKQVEAVRTTIAQLDGWGDTPVSAILCFVDAELPPFGSITVHGVPCIGPRRTAKWISQAGPYESQHRDALVRHLAAALPPR